MPSKIELIGGCAVVVLLAGCGSGAGRLQTAPAVAGLPAAATTSDYPMVLGAPYTIGGKTFTPADTLNFDEVGYALIRPGTGEGQPTASGIAYAAGAINASHRTLPMPSYVEVTSLTSGKTILVRVIDRGPMDVDHVIALSPGAAAQLGITADGEPVRVRRVNPPEQERAALRFGGKAAERLETPPGLRAALVAKLPATAGKAPAGVAPVRTVAVPAGTKPATPASVPAPVQPTGRLSVDEVVATAGADFSRPVSSPAKAAQPSAPRQAENQAPSSAPEATKVVHGRYAVQIAALGSREKADALAGEAGGHVTAAGALFRVRTGPYATQAQAKAAAAALQRKGFPEARMVVNDGR